MGKDVEEPNETRVLIDTEENLIDINVPTCIINAGTETWCERDIVTDPVPFFPSVVDALAYSNDPDTLCSSCVTAVVACLFAHTGTEPLVEKVAALEHTQWAHWTKHLLGKLKEVIGLGFYEVRDNNLDTPGIQKAHKALKRWHRQIETPYEELSEKEKDSDRKWARRVLTLVHVDATRVILDAKDKEISGLRAQLLLKDEELESLRTDLLREQLGVIGD